MFNRRFTALFFTLVFVDQLTKFVARQYLFLGQSFRVLPRFFELSLVHNAGAAYGLFQHQRFFLMAVSVTVISGIVFFQNHFADRPYLRWGAVALAAGATGNLLDRIFFGYVTDFINIFIFPVFNVADVTIDVGVACFVLDMLLTPKTKPHANS